MLVSFNRSTAVVLAGIMAATTIPASTATAQESELVVRGLPEGTRMEVVRFGDLNLRLIAHLDILNERIGSAVRRVCDFEPRDIARDSYTRCATAAWAGARPQMHMAYLRANRLASR